MSNGDTDPYAALHAPQPLVTDTPDATADPYKSLQPPPYASGTPDPSANPYSAYSTVGRMATDALFGLPDTANMLARGLNYGVDKGIQALTGLSPETLKSQITGPAQPAVPYFAPLARSAIGVSELPEDASMGRILAEAGGSALMGGVGSAVGRGVMRGVKALPELFSTLYPWGTVKSLTEDALHSSGGTRYRDLANLDVRLNETAPPKLADAIEYKLQQPGSRIPDYHAENTYKDINQLRNVNQTERLADGTVVTNPYATTNDVLGVRDLLNQTRTSNPLNPRERKAANIAIHGIDTFLEDIPPSAIHPSSVNSPSLVGQLARDARSDWGASERLGYLNRTEQAADLRAGARPPGSVNAAQAVRSRIADNLAANLQGRGPLYGFSPNELQALENVSTGSPLNRFGRFVGRAAPTSVLGASLQTGSAGLGGLAYYMGVDPQTAAIIGAAPMGIGFAGKILSNMGTRIAMKQARDLIGSRSALARELGVPVPSWEAVPRAPLVNSGDVAAGIAAGGGGLRQPTKIYINKPSPPLPNEDQQ